ncbi:MAG: PQQ-binding-like beta-propeller repeat protein [Propionibacteriaceae bacterium]|nr:PQQ-binding-like beta-propeller repeat protein [Propionibacteriaceae bacterium]
MTIPIPGESMTGQGRRCRLLVALVAAVLLLTSCWGESAGTPSSAPTTSAEATTAVGGTSPAPTPSPTGPPEQLKVTWEIEVPKVHARMAVPEGLVLLPDLAADNTTLKLLSWADGSELWSVDISKDLELADFLQAGPTMPPGQLAIWAEQPERNPSLLVYDAADGTLQTRIEGKEGHHLAVAESGAIYEMDTTGRSITISRAESARTFSTKQWTIQRDEEAREWFWVREHDGIVDFCVDGQAGPVYNYACYMSLHIVDGTPVAEDGMLYRSAWAGETLVGLEQGGPLKAFDRSGKELWSAEVSEGYPLGWGDHLLFFPDSGSPDLIALDPRTGQELWSKEWGDEAWSEPLIDQTPSPEDGPLVMVQAYPSVKTGVLDFTTGDVNLVDHGLTEYRLAEPSLGGTLLVASGDYEALKWTVVKPGESGSLWADMLTKYDELMMLDGRLVAFKGDRIALLEGR